MTIRGVNSGIFDLLVLPKNLVIFRKLPKILVGLDIKVPNNTESIELSQD